jgi:hypothetical protein
MRLSPQALHRNGVSPTSPDLYLPRLRGRTQSLFEAQAAEGIPYTEVFVAVEEVFGLIQSERNKYHYKKTAPLSSLESSR